MADGQDLVAEGGSDVLDEASGRHLDSLLAQVPDIPADGPLIATQEHPDLLQRQHPALFTGLPRDPRQRAPPQRHGAVVVQDLAVLLDVDDGQDHRHQGALAQLPPRTGSDGHALGAHLAILSQAVQAAL